MKKKSKFLLLLLTGIFSFASLLIINFSLYQTPKPLPFVYNISLVVNYNNGTIKEQYNFTLEDGKTTAFNALDKWCDVEYEEFSFGVIVRVIDGVAGSWIYMVNGFSPGVGAAVYALNDGALVKWERIA